MPKLSMLIEYAPLFINGLWHTIFICIVGIGIGLLLGLILYLTSTIRWPIFGWLVRCYVNVFRGTPLLIQLFLLFYGGPHFGIRFSAITTGILSLALYSSAYFSEIYRSGFQSIPIGQIEACIDLGLTPMQTLLHVKIPQMLTLIIPSVIGQTISMVKESSLLSIITVPELTAAAVKVSTLTFSIVEPYLLLALAYWLIVVGITKCGEQWERRQVRYLVLR
jgi:polar amino acid transport system permease protein